MRETYGELLLGLIFGTNVVFGIAASRLHGRLCRLERLQREAGSRSRHPGGRDL
jgi:hypothetical protein